MNTQTTTLRRPVALTADSMTILTGRPERGRNAPDTPPGRAASLLPPCPAGVHVARCSGWVDLGMQVNRFAGPAAVSGSKFQVSSSKAKAMQRRVLITWTIEGSAGERWRVSKEFSWCAGPRSALRKLLEEWRGRPYATDDEAWAVLRDPRRVLECACLVRVEHRQRGTDDATGASKVWTDIAGVWPLMKGVKASPLKWPPVLYVPGMANAAEVLRELPQWVRGKIGNGMDEGRRTQSIATTDDNL